MPKAKSWRRVGADWPPIGTYRGRWSGYIVRFEAGGQEYELDMECGVRGINRPCNVEVGAISIVVTERSYLS